MIYLLLVVALFFGGCSLPASETDLKVTTPMGWGIEYNSSKDQQWSVEIDELDPQSKEVVKKWRVQIGAKTSEAVLAAFAEQLKTQAAIVNAILPIIKAAAPVPVP